MPNYVIDILRDKNNVIAITDVSPTVKKIAQKISKEGKKEKQSAVKITVVTALATICFVRNTFVSLFRASVN